MPALNKPYQHRACLACGKRIPRWTDGKATPVSRVFCCNACGNHYRRRTRGGVTKGVAQIAKKRPINRAPFESVYVTEPRPEYPRCNACGRPYLRTSPAERFCSARCAEYVPLPPRKPDGEWFIAAGPLDYCDGCGLAVVPRKRQGFLAPVREMDGHMYCRECRPMRADKRVANDNSAKPIKRAA
jgi:predicted nucleic acid-binding Zn ribbon protein